MASAHKMLHHYLAAVEELAVLHGYKMEMSSPTTRRGDSILVTLRRGNKKHVGVGSTFSVALKRALISLKDAQVDRGDDRILDILFYAEVP